MYLKRVYFRKHYKYGLCIDGYCNRKILVNTNASKVRKILKKNGVTGYYIQSKDTNSCYVYYTCKPYVIFQQLRDVGLIPEYQQLQPVIQDPQYKKKTYRKFRKAHCPNYREQPNDNVDSERT